LLKESQLYVVE